MNATISKENKELIKEHICDILEIEPEDMTDTSRFKEDHKADSLRAVEILACLEKEFKIQIPQAELPKMTSINNTIEVLFANGFKG